VTGLVATAEIEIAAPPSAVWGALTDPERIKQYFFGAVVETDWSPGSTITWSGEYGGRPYLDKGRVVDVQARSRLEVTHFSPMTGKPDLPENYHTITYELSPEGTGTRLSLTQDNNTDADAVEHARDNWQRMLEALKRVVEEEPSE
jgi:uncharacterized protein YndB with AHSA1/START domain